MNCLRCDGLMVYEEFCDLLNTFPCFYGWRCILCGELFDPVILAHRAENRIEQPQRARRRYPNLVKV